MDDSLSSAQQNPPIQTPPLKQDPVDSPPPTPLGSTPISPPPPPPSGNVPPASPPANPGEVKPETAEVTKPKGKLGKTLKKHGVKIAGGMMVLALLVGGAFYGVSEVQKRQVVEKKANLYCKYGYNPKTGNCWTCFPAGTKILMEGGKDKNIEDVKIGDKVVSQSESGNRSISKVIELDQPIRKHMCQIDYADGDSLRLTNEHPLWSKSGWKSISPEATREENSELKISKLMVGDSLLKDDDSWNKVTGISCWSEKIQAYNLILNNGSRTYFANDYLAHNKKEVYEEVNNGQVVGRNAGATEEGGYSAETILNKVWTGAEYGQIKAFRQRCNEEGGSVKESDVWDPRPDDPSKAGWEPEYRCVVGKITSTSSPNPSASPSPTAEFACVDLTSDPLTSEIVVGDMVTFTCEGSFSSVPNPMAFFKTVMGTDEWISPEVAVNLETGEASFDIEIDKAGDWLVQCRVCTDSTATSCTEWGLAN